LNEVVAEDGQAYRNVIEMVRPIPATRGWRAGDWRGGGSSGYMLPLELPYNARFTTRVGMARLAAPTVRPSSSAWEENGRELVAGVASYDGKLDIDIDLVLRQRK
jgi:hypothetical protein